METFLYIVFFLSCVILIAGVLLQPGKTDAGALFTSSISSAAMNPRGTQSVLSKLTITTATVFMLTGLLLSLPAIKGNVSVLETEGERKPAATQGADAGNANANTNAGGNVNSNAPANSAEEKPAANGGSGDNASDDKKAGEKDSAAKDVDKTEKGKK